MSHFDYVIEILQALDAWYQEGENGPVAGALLFSDDRTLKEHIREALNCATPVHCLNGPCRIAGECQKERP